MQSNTHNPTSSYYREHTRQQDGWTVLVPPPAANRSDLPPPYTAAPAPAIAPAVASANGAVIHGEPVTLSFDIPINSNVIGVTPVTRTKKYGRQVPFSVGYTEICGLMGLDSTTAVLGYKWDKEKRNDPVHGLANAADWNNCLETGIGLTARARTRQVTCIIKNLNLPEEAASSAKPTASKKRKGAADPSDDRKTFDFTKEYRALKARLSCATHKAQLCYVAPLDGHHHHVEPHQVSLWAKEISVGNATSTSPPQNIVFQDFFLPGRKRARTTSTRAESSSAPCAPTIHVTVNTGGSGSGSSSVTKSPPHRSPLATITGASANWDNIEKPSAAAVSDNNTNIDIPTSLFRSQSHIFDENSISDGVRYPPTADILQLIDDSGIFDGSAVLPFPAITFVDSLDEWQITRVDHVAILSADFFVQQVNMPEELATLFVEESIVALTRAEKGKGRATEF
ncbi:hypothetical protein C8J57DRAFT_1647254 [Mycena rebaudengoi]|nr:hypothetical protein C8J57DRAFT_1647254 [Mycena rebaudengoi]